MTDGLRAILLPLWPALAAAAALGVAFGWLGWRERSAGFGGRLGLILAIVAFGAGASLAVLGQVPGRPGLWLETALATALAYLAGCILGSLVRVIWTRLLRGSDKPTSPA